MKSISDFTPEIQAKIPEYIKKYTDGVFNGKRFSDFNFEKATELINWNYETCNYKKPTVLVAENPYESQIFFNYINENKDRFIPILYVLYCLKNNIELPKELTEIKLENSQLYSQLRSQLYSQLGSQLGKYNNDYLFTTNIYSGSYGAWFKFIKDEFKLESEIGTTLDLWNNLYQESGVYSAIFSELVCVISKYPKYVHRNQNNDLHNLESFAVEWNKSTELTKFNCNYINGRFIPEKYFNSILDKSFKIEDFINESNEEYKSTCIAFMQKKYGDEYLVNFFRQYLKETDTYVNKKEDIYLEGTTKGMNVGVYTLFKGKINGEKIAYVRCYCPSTDRMFFLGVDDKHSNVKDAIASLYRIPSKLKQHIKSISRQGERYSTILTENGKKVLSSLSEKEISNVTNIDGESYFNLIKYEY